MQPQPSGSDGPNELSLTPVQGGGPPAEPLTAKSPIGPELAWAMVVSAAPSGMELFFSVANGEHLSLSLATFAYSTFALAATGFVRSFQYGGFSVKSALLFACLAFDLAVALPATANSDSQGLGAWIAAIILALSTVVLTVLIWRTREDETNRGKNQ